MSLTIVNWPLIITLIAISAVVIFRRPTGSGGEQLSLASRKAQPAPKDGNSGAPDRRLGLVAPAIVFLLIAGIGAAGFYLGEPRAKVDAADTSTRAPPDSDPDDESLASLSDYAQSVGAGEPASKAAPGEMLPDVSTMIERLAARLESAPANVDGWRMLGWAHFNTGHYEQAASAYAKALELDPGSNELKLAYGEAKAKAATSGDPATTSSLPSAAAAPSDEQASKIAAAPVHERDAAIRSMVDGLAARLESSPRDVEGWARLIRSRVVLGESELAAAAFRQALDVFKDDSAASSAIVATANELGLKAE